MLFYSLPIINGHSNGLLPFDLRPSGYDFDEAKIFLNALSVEGVDFYQNVQLKLDTAYPALMAISLILAYWILSPIKWGIWRFVIFPFAIIAAIFDYLENAYICKMLQLGADAITPEIVQTASGFSSNKALFVAISSTILLFLIGLWGWRKFANNRKA